jgi:hypothetical protein
MAPIDEAHEDVELGDLENDAFIPKPYDKPSIFTRWMPHRLRDFFENLSRIKVSLTPDSDDELMEVSDVLTDHVFEVNVALA